MIQNMDFRDSNLGWQASILENHVVGRYYDPRGLCMSHREN